MLRLEITPGSVPSQTPGCVSMGLANRAPRIPAWQLDDRVEPRRYEDQQVRTFNPKLAVWEAAPPCPEPEVTPGNSSAIPEHDGSGVWWVAYEYDHNHRRYGQPVWTFQAADFDRALAEKLRLCSLAGYKNGWIRLKSLSL